MSALPLSAIVLTRDEQANIARCLESLSFCGEIILVDAESRDRTCEIARKYTDKIHVLPWEGFTAQRNRALDFASFDWILSIDADEVVPSPLQDEIRALFLGGPPSLPAYSIPRKTIHLGRWIRHGGWYPNRLTRLFDRRQGKWEGGQVHERWDCRGETGQLKADLEHFSFTDLSDQVDRNNRYSSLGAQELATEWVSFSWVRLLLKPLGKFLETYFFKRGFLDGYPSFIISVSAAYSVFLKWAKLWERQNAQILRPELRARVSLWR